MNDSNGAVKWQSPSNIAIVKYWGKFGEQLPANPSLSLTLSAAHTTTQVEYQPGSGQVDFYFEGERNPAFAQRIGKFIQRLAEDSEALRGLDYVIRSENSFPHSAGIASSASAMSAMALCMGTISRGGGQVEVDSTFSQQASHNARLGSGSACRSVDGPVMVWGSTSAVVGSSEMHAVKVDDAADVFSKMRDAILIIDQGEKQVKSSAGHALMHDHPYSMQRFERAREHMIQLIAAVRSGDIEKFGEIAEAEAFDLHAMMMASSPPYLLIKPGTVSAIEQLRSFRSDTGLPVYFTLDAGPNLHILYPDFASEDVEKWIESDLKPLCHEGRVIYDRVGTGPVQLL